MKGMRIRKEETKLSGDDVIAYIEKCEKKKEKNPIENYQNQ